LFSRIPPTLPTGGLVLRALSEGDRRGVMSAKGKAPFLSLEEPGLKLNEIPQSWIPKKPEKSKIGGKRREGSPAPDGTGLGQKRTADWGKKAHVGDGWPSCRKHRGRKTRWKTVVAGGQKANPQRRKKHHPGEACWGREGGRSKIPLSETNPYCHYPIVHRGQNPR